MKIIYNLNDEFYFKWRQIVNLVPKTWKKVLKKSQSDSSNLVLLQSCAKYIVNLLGFTENIDLK